MRTAGDRHSRGLHHLAAHLHALEGSLHVDIQEHGHPRRPGVSALLTHCLELSVGFFAFTVATNVVRDFMPCRYNRYVPLPTAMAVPFLMGANFTVNMCIGSVRLAQDEQCVEAELLPSGAGRRFRFHLRRRDMNLPVLVALLPR
jgi:hypothetical protein